MVETRSPYADNGTHCSIPSRYPYFKKSLSNSTLRGLSNNSLISSFD